MSDEAYAEGFEAGKSGKRLRNNPYSRREADAYLEWRRGWFDGRLAKLKGG
jgi:hypothetical protein